MKYFYGEYDGEEFPTPDKLFSFNQLMDFIMQYGEQALRAMQQMMQNPKDESQSDMLEQVRLGVVLRVLHHLLNGLERLLAVLHDELHELVEPEQLVLGRELLAVELAVEVLHSPGL